MSRPSAASLMRPLSHPGERSRRTRPRPTHLESLQSLGLPVVRLPSRHPRVHSGPGARLARRREPRHALPHAGPRPSHRRRRHRRPPPHRTHRRPGRGRATRPLPPGRDREAYTVKPGRHRHRPRRPLPRLDRRADLPQPPRPARHACASASGSRSRWSAPRSARTGSDRRTAPARRPGSAGQKTPPAAARTQPGVPRHADRVTSAGHLATAAGASTRELALAVSWQESGWQMHHVSSANAIGAMQVLPRHRRLDVVVRRSAAAACATPATTCSPGVTAARRARRPDPLAPAPGRGVLPGPRRGPRARALRGDQALRAQRPGHPPAVSSAVSRRPE